VILPPLPYQITGSDFLVNHPARRAALFDEPGVGKTAQTIFAMDKARVRRAVIVAPAGVHKAGVWQGEFKKFASQPRRIIKHRDVNDLKLWLSGRADVLLMSYEAMTKYGPKMKGDLIDAVVFDEAHYLKGPDSARTLAAYGRDAKGETGLARWGVYNWFLSGTPAPNEVFDIWTWLRYVGGTPLNMAPFKARYFKTRPTTYGETAEIRKEALAELQMAISAYSIRRTAKGVGLDLPPIWYTTVSLDGDTREIAALLRQYPNLEPMIVTALEQGGLSKLDAPHIATLRRLIAEAKAPAYVELLDHELRNGLDKVVIMGLHTRALSLICDELAKRGHVGIRVDGTVTSDKKRTAGVKAFQEDPEVRFAACNMMAAGVGLTMTAGAALDLFEEAWTPATNAQAIKRVHRYGQTRKVRARFISLANSLDQHVSETNARKTAQITQLEEGIAA
jgi:SNF2 family DNA or RNA helicase